MFHSLRSFTQYLGVIIQVPSWTNAEPGKGRLKGYHSPHHRICNKPEQLPVSD